jgi:diguanylate cyclase (GGDEF)-like protein
MRSMMPHARRWSSGYSSLDFREILRRGPTATAVNESIEAQIAALLNLAFTDQLTTLLNRRGVQEIVAVVPGTAGSIEYGVVMIDLTGFKRLNDGDDHSGGDAGLGEVARTLLEITSPPASIPFRWGGDEFGILVANESFETFVSSGILSRLRWPDFTWNNRPLPFGASVGFAAPCEEGLGEAITRADKAASVSKQERDVPIRWTPNLQTPEIVKIRFRCPDCTSSVEISVRTESHRPGRWRCPNSTCGQSVRA